VLRRGPLAFYGRISYGLYMIHIMVFIFFGWFDARMDRYGIAGNLAVVAFRWPHPRRWPPRSGTASSRRFSSSNAIFSAESARLVQDKNQASRFSDEYQSCPGSLQKRSTRCRFVSGHDFSRAEKAAKGDGL
jgi:hypothetical protein